MFDNLKYISSGKQLVRADLYILICLPYHIFCNTPLTHSRFFFLQAEYVSNIYVNG